MKCRTCRTCVKQPLSKRPKIGFQYQLLLNAGQGCELLTFLDCGDFYHLFIIFANSLDPVLDPNHLTLWQCSWKNFFEKVRFEKSQQMTTKEWKHFPACKDLNQTYLLLPCMLGKFLFSLVVCWYFFFKVNFIKKFFQEYHQSVKPFGKRINPDILSGLVWVQTVCKDNQQIANLSKDFCCRALKATEASNLEINYFGF